jgi:Fur family transcriptional regulator, ferric uptake regulator
MIHDEAIRQQLEAHLAARGLKRTRQRAQILELLLGETEHLTMETLVGRVHRVHPRIGQATVYRAVRLFEDAGILARHKLAGSHDHLELQAPQAEHHDHLVCMACGRIVEFADPVIEAHQEALAAAHGYRLEGHSHVIRGTCPACLARG